jgi:HAD superfamily hydrolase (TIGR01662 family)
LPNTSHPALAGRAIRCLLFDLGDTLWSRRDTVTWERLEVLSNRRAASLLRQHVDSRLLPALDDALLGQRLRQSFDTCVREQIRLQPDVEPKGAQAVAEVLHGWGISGVENSLGEAIFETLRIRIPESRPLFKDTLSTLAELERRGYLLGVVTNRIWGGKPFQEDLHVLGLDHFFHPQAIAVSGDLGLRKPNPAMFLHALKGLNARPEEAIMVGDSLSADVLGAQQAGILAAWKPKKKIRKRIEELRYAASSKQHDTAAPTTATVSTTTPGAHASHTPSSPLPGLLITDDDFVLAQDRNRDYLERFVRGEIVPDLIIHHLRDLLEIFLEAGAQ